MNRISRDDYGLTVARAVAARADCTRRQVGAVIMDDEGRIVSTGYNGAPAGEPGCASAGACPRGQLAYASEAPYKVGDPDPTPGPWATESDYCGLLDESREWDCTIPTDNGVHDGWHIAGDGETVCFLWPPAGTQAHGQSYESGESRCIAVHAEANAIVYAGRERTKGATIYVTDEPCYLCALIIKAAGITRVVVAPKADPATPWADPEHDVQADLQAAVATAYAEPFPVFRGGLVTSDEDARWLTPERRAAWERAREDGSEGSA